MGLVMQALAWVVFMALVGAWISGRLERQYNPNQRVDTHYLDDGAREVVLKRSRSGHYLTAGAINGHPVVFMLDTGATGIAVPQDLARALDLEPGRQLTTRTANGLATAYATRLDRVSVGDIALDNVPATITPGLAMEEVLLGMSFLKHIEFTQRGDTLILRQYPEPG
ncbi:retropepsin-like aspartic protease family protein [Parahaliea mediterranea]|nr:TIGR02281 family clan AA aspartic protease [Parahaliea mediterranea]